MAGFTEQATLQLRDQSSKQINQINAALRKLFATARSGKNIKLDLGLRNITRQQSQLRKLTSDMQRLNRQTTIRLNSTQLDTALNKATRLQGLLRSMSGRVQLPTTGGGVPGGSGGVGGRQPNNVFWGRGSDTNWTAAGRIIARSFVSAIGFSLHQMVTRATRSAGTGIASLDTARAVANASGVDVAALERSATQAAADSTGVPIAEIMSAATEQAGALQTQLKSGALNQDQFNAALDALTKRVAETAQIIGTARGDFARGTEDARQVEKAIAITSAGLDQRRKDDFSNAILNAMVASGGDVTGDEVKRTLQQLGSTFASSFSPEGLARLVLIRDEGGRQSTAEIRMGLQDLIRGNLNEQDLANQIKAGLRDTQGRTTLTEAERRDPVKIAQDRLLPIVRAAGIDLTDTIAVTDYLDNVAGFTTGGSRFFARAISQIEQYENELQRFQQTQSRSLLTPTITAQIAEINAAWQDSAGQLASQALPLAKMASKGISESIEALGKGELPSAGALAGLAGAGVSASLTAMLDPTTRPLGAAALGLSASAVALDGAALALTGAAVVQGTKGGLGGLAGGAGAAAGGGFLRNALRFLATAGGVAAITSLIKPAAEDMRERQGGSLTTDPRGTIAEWLASINPKLFQDRDGTKPIKVEIANLAKAPPNAAQQAIDAAGGGGRIATMGDERIVIDRATVQLQAADMKAIRFDQQEQRNRDGQLNASQLIAANELGTAIASAMKQSTPIAGGTPIPMTGDTMLQGMDTLVATPDKFASTFAAGDAALGMTADTFASTFLNGATNLGTAGNTFGTNANSSLNAAGAGAAFGDAAAARISAAANAITNAVSNIQVNVNAKVNNTGGGVDTGGQAPVE